MSQAGPSRQVPPQRAPNPSNDTGVSHKLVVQRVVRDSGGLAMYPALTRSNYGDWALMMQVMLEARGLWTAVVTGTAEREQDRMALEAILRTVPPEMISTLAIKPTTKEAWDTLKTMRLGVDRVRKAKAQSLRK